MRHLFLLLALMLSFSALAATLPGASARPVAEADSAAPAELAIVLLSPETVVTANFPRAEEFSAWLNPVLDACREVLATEKKPPALLVQVTVRRQEDPRFELAGKPALSRALTRRLRAALDAVPPLRAPVCDIALRIQTPGSGSDPMADSAAFRPRLVTPDAAADAAFAAADLAGQLALLRSWAREQGLPLLAHSAASGEERFVGVRNTGRALLALEPSGPLDIPQLTYHNPDFWRGVVEMAPGNQLIGAMPAVLFAANGEIDQATTLSGILIQFAMEDSLARVVLTRLRGMIEVFNRKVAAEMQRGIKLHDRKNFDRAIAVYREVLEAYPASAWARYEVFFATFARSGHAKNVTGSGENPTWEAAAPEIYRCNPLYDTQFAGTRGRTMGAMFDRLTLRFMGEKPSDDPGERFGTIGEVALHLENYGPAAQVFWAILHTRYGPKTRVIPAKEPTVLTTNDVLARFLYCLEQLGVTGIKDNFQGDFPEEFGALDAALHAWRTQ